MQSSQQHNWWGNTINLWDLLVHRAHCQVLWCIVIGISMSDGFTKRIQETRVALLTGTLWPLKTDGRRCSWPCQCVFFMAINIKYPQLNNGKHSCTVYCIMKINMAEEGPFRINTLSRFLAFGVWHKEISVNQIGICLMSSPMLSCQFSVLNAVFKKPLTTFDWYL